MQYSTGKREFFFSQLLCIEFDAPRTNFNINSYEKEIAIATLYPRAFALRPNRALLVLAIFKRVIDEKMFALRLRTSST